MSGSRDAGLLSPFVGRGEELARLGQGLESALTGRGSLFLLVGEPGIGKTRLADELAGRARQSSVVALWGRCWESGGAPAYWPWVQILRACASSLEPALLAERLRGAPDLLHLLPERRTLGWCVGRKRIDGLEACDPVRGSSISQLLATSPVM